MDDYTRRWTAAVRAGAWEQAWSISDAIGCRRDPARRDDPTLPYHRRWLWDGAAPDGADVLVRCYHGLGDTIMFARFLPALAARAARVTVEAQAELLPFLTQLPGVGEWVAFDPARPLPPRAHQVEIMELAHALRMSPDAVPPPYLRAAPAPLPAGTVAVCHNSSGWDPDRRLPEQLLEALCRRHRCVTAVPAPTALPVGNPGGCSTDIAETAALLAGAAAVVTIDSMVAHLTGALGRPTFVALKAEPDWRWTPGARRSRWYPTLRLHHQPRPGDWAGAMATLERELDDHLSGRPLVERHEPALVEVDAGERARVAAEAEQRG